MSKLDVGNAVFEAGGAWVAWRSTIRLYRDKQIRGAYWPAWFVFSLWGIWNAVFYYSRLKHWFSFAAGLVLVAGNLVWCCLALKYKDR